MKLSKVFSASVLFAGLVWSSFSLALTPTQKAELYKYGTITVYTEDGQKKGHYEVKFMPGSENITSDAKDRWAAAADLMDDFVDREDFWEKKFVGSFMDGIDFAKRSLVDEGVGAIPGDFKDTVAANNRIDGDFGATAGKTKNWIKFGLGSLGRVVISVAGTIGGGVYAVLAPVGHVVYRPIAAGTQAVVAGTIWPVIKYSWNGTAWILTKGNNEPNPGDMTVTYIPENLPEEVSAELSAEISAQ